MKTWVLRIALGSLACLALLLTLLTAFSSSSARLGFGTRNASGTTYDPYISITYAGAAASEEVAPAVEGIPNPTVCEPTIGRYAWYLPRHVGVWCV